MTYKQFLKELSAFKGRFLVTAGGLIRNKDREAGYCPIAAINMAHGGPNSCRAPFFTSRTIDRIAAAADGYVNERTPARRRIRKDLLRVLGILGIHAAR